MHEGTSKNDAFIQYIWTVCRMFNGRTFSEGQAEVAVGNLLSSVANFVYKMEKKLYVDNCETNYFKYPSCAIG